MALKKKSFQSYPGVSRQGFLWLWSISFHIWVMCFISWVSDRNQREQTIKKIYLEVWYIYSSSQLLVRDDIYTRKLGQKPHHAPPLNQLSQPDVPLQSPVLSVPAGMSDVRGAACVLADHTRDPHTCTEKAFFFRKGLSRPNMKD